jgi:Fic-DOC domain mobile mystery protein B
MPLVNLSVDGGPGKTSLTQEEQDGLIPAYITFRHERDAAEWANIIQAESRLFGRRSPAKRGEVAKLIDEDYILGAHKLMFGEVWRWAGTYRRSDKNIGQPWVQVPIEMRQFLDNARVWHGEKVYAPDEFAVRFHHRLVFIHPFPNGNGRLTRMMADLLITALGGERFTWGRAGGDDLEKVRQRYFEALQTVDYQYDIGPLLAFARA